MADGAAGDSLQGEAGFASVDAMAGLAILAVTIALALSAHAMARRMSDAAVESRRAAALLQMLVDDRGATADSGSFGGFEWRVEVLREPAQGVEPRSSVCRRAARVQSLASGRAYTLDTLAPCPEPGR